MSNVSSLELVHEDLVLSISADSTTTPRDLVDRAIAVLQSLSFHADGGIDHPAPDPRTSDATEPTWPERDDAACSLGKLMAKHILTGASYDFTPVTSKRNRVFFLVRDKDGHVYQPARVLTSAQIKPLVESAPGVLSPMALKGGFPSQRELQYWQKGFDSQYTA